MTKLTEDEAAQLGADVLSGIHNGEPAPLGALVLAYVSSSAETTLVIHAQNDGCFVVWDADAGVEVHETEATAMGVFARGLANAWS